MSEAYIVLKCTSVGIIWLLIVKKNFDVETKISDYYPLHSLFTLHSHGQLFFPSLFLDSSAWLLTFGHIPRPYVLSAIPYCHSVNL